MQKEYIVASNERVGNEITFNLVNMEDFNDFIICSNDLYWSSVEGQLFYEDEFRVEDDIAYPIIDTLNDF
jgi:hypothetical protein